MQAIVLLSGGLDSTTVAAHALHEGYEVRALSIGYGQRHIRELASARAVADALGIPLLTVDAGFYAGLASHSALTDSATYALPENRDPAQMAADIPITYVPLRNTFFVTLAAAALESWLLSRIERDGADPASLSGAIFVGANAIDYSGYPDCRPEFVHAFESLANLATRAGVEGARFTVHTPLMALDKGGIIRLGVSLGVDYAITHSCYDPASDGRACGACDSCLLRARGFREAGVPDPTRYSPLPKA